MPRLFYTGRITQRGYIENEKLQMSDSFRDMSSLYSASEVFGADLRPIS